MKYKFILFFLALFISTTIASFILFQIPLTKNKQLETNYIPSLTSTSTLSLSLDTIFSDNHSWVNNLPKEKTITLIATGDVILARSVNYQAAKLNNFRWPYEKTAEVLRSADLTVINLESPLIPNCQLTNSGMIFCGDEKNIEGLIFAGVDVATLENNHIENYGITGIENTIKLLNETGIKTVREDSPQIIDVKGQKIVILAYHDLINPQIDTISIVEEKIVSEIKEVRKKANIVIVAFHWGVEYTKQPSIRQRFLAHLAIDNGADLILGNHPHWIQPVEIYNNKLIVYSHGNFIFDQMWSEETKKGAIGRYTFYEGKLIDAEFLPVYIKDYGQPYFWENKKKKKIISEMKTSSIKLLNTYNQQ